MMRVWDEDDVRLLGLCVARRLSAADASDLLGIGMGDYLVAVNLFGFDQHAPVPALRDCLMCGCQFKSENTRTNRVCDPCKDTPVWRFAGAYGRAHVGGRSP